MKNSSARQGSSRPLSGLSDIEDRYDAALCDIWGVLHNGVVSFGEAVEALRQWRRRGKSVTLVTNAPRPKGEVAAQLAALGVTRDAFDEIATSGDVSAQAIAERRPGRPYHIGPTRDLPVFDAASVLAGEMIVPVGLDKASFAVCTGLLDDTTETPADYEEVLSACRQKNLIMLCANPDLVVYRGEQLIYCAGALAARYEEMGGEVAQAGKPYAPIYQMALGLSEQARRRPLDLNRVLAIGDALHTDIAGAQAMGLDSLLITTGIHRDELYDQTGEWREDAYARLLAEHGVAPDARMSRLSW